MKKRLLLVLVLGLSFAPPVLGGEKIGQQSMNDTFQTAAAGVDCKEGLRAKSLPSEDFGSRDPRAAAAQGARQ